MRWSSKNTPYTTREILNATDPNRKLRSASIKMLKYSAEYVISKIDGKKRVFVKFRIITQSHYSSRSYNNIIVVPYMKDFSTRTLSNLPVQFFSTCPDFIFRFAHLFAKTTNLYIGPENRGILERAISEFPESTNPLGTVSLDKHTYFCLTHLDKLKLPTLKTLEKKLSNTSRVKPEEVIVEESLTMKPSGFRLKPATKDEQDMLNTLDKSEDSRKSQFKERRNSFFNSTRRNQGEKSESQRSPEKPRNLPAITKTPTRNPFIKKNS